MNLVRIRMQSAYDIMRTGAAETHSSCGEAFSHVLLNSLVLMLLVGCHCRLHDEVAKERAASTAAVEEAQRLRAALDAVVQELDITRQALGSPLCE